MLPMRATLLLLAFACVTATVQAGPLRDMLKERRAAHQAQGADGGLAGEDRGAVATVPPGVSVVRNVSYGSDPAERFDVYLPQGGAHDAPVIFMVHGGGWSRGDKTMQSVVENKAARWVPRGIILISTDYPMLPGANPVQQAGHVAKAIAAAQAKAASWGGDPSRFVLMGHSAGAHLVSLITSSRQIASAGGVRSWLGTVALDSAAFNVEQIMRHRHLSLYDQAFGAEPAFWRAASPIDQLSGPTAPLLAVCSSKRADSCPQAHEYVLKTTRLGTHASVLEEDLSHRDINAQLGLPGAYTDGVENFLRSLDAGLAALLR